MIMLQIDDKAVQTPFEGGRMVRLHFSKQDAPERIVFVLKELQPENWINNGSCYSVQVCVTVIVGVGVWVVVLTTNAVLVGLVC